MGCYRTKFLAARERSVFDSLSGPSRVSSKEACWRETMGIVISGLTLGVPLALVATRALGSTLYGVKVGDPGTLGGAVVIMLTVATLAGFTPSWWASRVDPMVALRYR